MNTTIKEADYWNDYLCQIPEGKQDIYFTEEYLKLYENESSKVKCFIYQEEDKLFLFPYLKREIICETLPQQYFDIESQYGYGGPICNSKDIIFLKKATDELIDSCAKQNIVCGFIRFHPVLNNHLFIVGNENIYFDRKTVVIDLELTINEIWENQIHSKHRNEIRKAEKNGLEFIVDKDFKYLPEFILLYNKRMEKLSADSYYYFDKGYYNKIKTDQNINITTRKEKTTNTHQYPTNNFSSPVD